MRRWFASIVTALVGLVAGCGMPAVHPRSPEVVPGAVVFRYRAPSARIVQVAGSWDENTFLRGRDAARDTRVARLEDPEGDGIWEVRVPLGPGRYEYLFLLDGRFWELDPQNPQRVPDGAGGEWSLVVVP